MALDPRSDPYVLTGRVVTMDKNGRVIPDGAVYVRAGTIHAVRQAADAPPHGFERATRIATGDTLYPGMIELHNHLAYNAVPLWRVPRRYVNNEGWRGTDEALRAVTKPAEVLARTPGIAEAMVRYAEARCLLGGVTTSQGITLMSRPGIEAFFQGVVRNVERPGVAGLPAADTRIGNPDKGKAKEYLAALTTMSCRLQHLSEGLGETARGWFLRLKLPRRKWAITEAFCGIHATALLREDFDAIAANKGSVVWSPLSNYLLYGDTANIRAMKESDVLVGLGSDWSPSGSKNLLGELKVAWLASRAAGEVFTPEELVAMATINGARILKWTALLGSLEEGKLADIFAVRGTGGDPYEHLLEAPDSAVTLVMIDGIPRVGQRGLMRRFRPIGVHEQITVGRSPLALDLAPTTGADPLGGITLTEANHRLREALADLPTLAADLDSGIVEQGFSADLGTVMGDAAAAGGPGGVQRWVVKLDFAEEDAALTLAHGVFDSGSLADFVEPMAFEGPTVADDPGFLGAIVHALNVPRFVKEGLPALYGRRMRVPDDAVVGGLDPAVRAELGEVGDLAVFLAAAPGQLSRTDRLRILDQALAVLERHYVHLPLKRARYAVDPLQRLRVLRREVEEIAALPPEIDFHADLIETFASLRDLHTAYQLPFPYRTRVGWLPFLVEECVDEGTTHLLVTRVVGNPGPESFGPGVELLHWNGVPIRAAIRQLERAQQGSNPAARHARAVATLTIRPLRHLVAPQEEWVALRYRPPGSEEPSEFTQRWLVSTPRRGTGRIELEDLALGATELGVDSEVDELNGIRAVLFAGAAAQQERQARAEGRTLRMATRHDDLASSLPTVLRARRLSIEDEEYGYLRIFRFNVADPEEFVDECERLLAEFPATGLIVDVRGNGGGSIIAAESLLALLSPLPIEPERTQFIASAANLELCRAHADSATFPGLRLAPWADSIDAAIDMGAPYSLGYPISDPALVNQRTQMYQGPKVLIVDPLCYSATDIFAAGFADHGVGPILGVAASTGAGGANVWSHRVLRALSRPRDATTLASPFEPLPLGADLRVAIRRTLRVGRRAGEIVEDFGVAPDRIQPLTRADILGSNEDLLVVAAGMLADQPRRSLDVAVHPGDGGPPVLKVRGQGIDRVDVRVNGWHLRSVAMGQGPMRLDLEEYDGPPSNDLDVELVGVQDGQVVVRRRELLPNPS